MSFVNSAHYMLARKSAISLTYYTDSMCIPPVWSRHDNESYTVIRHSADSRAVDHHMEHRDRTVPIYTRILTSTVIDE